MDSNEMGNLEYRIMNMERQFDGLSEIVGKLETRVDRLIRDFAKLVELLDRFDDIARPNPF